MSQEMIRLLEEARQEVGNVNRLIEDPLLKNWVTMAEMCLLNAQLLIAPRVKDSFRSKLRLWGAAVIPSFAKDEAKGTGGPTSERLPTAQSLVIATETGPAPAGKGEPVMAVSAPVLGSIVYPETLPELTFAT